MPIDMSLPAEWPCRRRKVVSRFLLFSGLRTMSVAPFYFRVILQARLFLSCCNYQRAMSDFDMVLGLRW